MLSTLDTSKIEIQKTFTVLTNRFNYRSIKMSLRRSSGQVQGLQ